MIYDRADMIARRLLGKAAGPGEVFYWSAKTAEEIASHLRCKDRMVVTAPRGTGKTTELLRYAEERCPDKDYVVVCLNQDRQRQIIRRHWEMYNASNVAKRLMGQRVESFGINPPLMIHLDNFHLLRGQRRGIFVDEFDEFQEQSREALLDNELFVAAVTSR